MYNYVASSFLDGLMNYTEPVSAVLLERYKKLDRERFNEVYRQVHTKLSSYQDDVILLCREKEAHSRFWIFWYDCDTSDCSLGWFSETSSSDQMITAEFDRWLDSLIQSPDLAGREREGGIEGISGWQRITSPKGWLSW